MTLIIIAFIAGFLTVLAPCTLPLLPVIIGGSVSDSDNSRHSKLKPYIITASLALSIIIFTLIIRVSTSFIDIPQSFWAIFAGVILVVFSLTMVFPITWAKLTCKLGHHKAERVSNSWLAKASKKGGYVGDVLMGAALGPVFSSCSPTYFVILAAVLPQSFATGLFLLAIYSIGLAVPLLGISLLGQKLVKKLHWASDPSGKFKKIIGILFLIVGLAVLTGVDKVVETYLIDQGFNFIELEESLLNKVEIDTTSDFEVK